MNQLIIDWCNYCEGKMDFDKSHFHTLFWDNINESNLKVVFQYFPNSIELYNLTYDYLYGTTEKISEKIINEALIELALKDIREKKKIINNSNLINLLENFKVEFVYESELVIQSKNTSPYIDFFDSLNDEISDNWIMEDKKNYALYEAFYGLTKHYEMAWYLFKPLTSININLDYYYQFTSLRGIYSFLGNKLIVSRE